MREIARQGRDAQAWKTYLQAHRQEKQEWKGERIERASSDWKLYKSLTKAKRAWGDEYMVASTAANPVAEIKQHFDTVFHDDRRPDIEGELQKVSQRLCCDQAMVPFSKQEVVRAITQGKTGKATGPDGVPTELLRDMMQHEPSIEAFQDFFNQIMQSGDVPRQWDRSVVTLLPKILPPSAPKQLRPIALASHYIKGFRASTTQQAFKGTSASGRTSASRQESSSC